MAKISIIVPVYNVEKYIDRCLQSLISQTYKDIEIIIINDGSTDNSLQICEKYAQNDKRIKLYSKKNEGLGLTRNYGIDKSNGDYIAFVDSDDFVTENMCESLLEAAEQYNAEVVYGNVYYYDNGMTKEKNKIIETTVWQKNEVSDFLLDLIGTKPSEKNDTIMEVSVWKALFKKEVFEKFKIRFVSEREYISEDIIFDIDFLSKVNKVVAIKDFVYYYCVNPNSLSKSFRADRFEKVKKLYFKIIDMLKKYYPQEKFQERTDRLLLARARTNIRQIVKHRKVLNKKETKEAIMKICNDKDLKEILDRYNINSLPKKYSLVAKLIKWKKYNLLILVFSIFS